MNERDEGVSSFHDEHGGGDTQAPGSEVASDVSFDSPIAALDTSILGLPIAAAAQSPASASAPPHDQSKGDASSGEMLPSAPSAPLKTPETTNWAARVNAAFDALDAYDMFTELGLQSISDGAPVRRVDEGNASAAPQARRAAPPTQRVPRARQSGWRRRAFLLGIILVCFLLGYGGIFGAFTVSDALAAVRDAKAQGVAIQSILSGGHLTEVATLKELQAHLQALDIDLRRIKSDEPGQPMFTDALGGTAPVRALNMAQDLTWAGLYAVDAGLAVAPHIKSIIGSVTGSASGGGAKKPSAGASSSGPLTLAEINQASTDVNAAGSLVTLALVERAHVRDSDLQALGLGSFVHTLHTLDAFAPNLPKYLGYGRQLLAALPDLLGVTKPVNYLLFDLDSDELRPSGGFQGVYSVLTFKAAQLTSGVHLQNIYAIDCPHGFPPNCAPHPLPASYSWFTYPDGLRNANLDPNYPTTARLDERMLAAERGPAVAGVISLTPIIIQQALTLTGPLAVPGYPQKITAQNFSELIHYYHSIIGSANISKAKAFDAAAGGALLRAFSQLSQANQSKLTQALLTDLRSGDLQLYFNDQRMESLLTTLELDGALRAPAGDTFKVVNTNHGANYANIDVTATETDHVVINAQGAATHTLTITYHFPVKSHLYTSYLVSVYRDFIQVIAPPHAHLQSIRGCAPVKITEPGWSDWSCNMTLWRGGSATVVFQWVTPSVATKTISGATQYNLLVQRQSGTHDALSVTITPPAGARITQPLMAGLTLAPGNQARYGAKLTNAQAISLAWAG